jgi:hypothetical protein
LLCPILSVAGTLGDAGGSYDVYLAPKDPAGKESSWLQTIPGKSWFTILRMYGPRSCGSIRAGSLRTLC